LAIPGFPGIENVMNGGLVIGSTTLLYGGSGYGKTTLCLLIAHRIGLMQRRPVLYISSEQTQEQVKLTAIRCRSGISESTVLLAYETDPESVCDAIREVRPIFAVLDSLSAVSLELGLVPVMLRIGETAKGCDTTLLATLHETKDGDYHAPRQLEHVVDCMVHFQRSDDYSSYRYWKIPNKYRFGPTNQPAAVIRMDANGVPHDGTGRDAEGDRLDDRAGDRERDSDSE
jgi:DNA repair protein RadA/Sms